MKRSLLNRSIILGCVFATIFMLTPHRLQQKFYLAKNKLTSTFTWPPANYSDNAVLNTSSDTNSWGIPAWEPLPHTNSEQRKAIRVGEKYYDSLERATESLKDGDTMIIGAGVYNEPIVIRPDNVSVVGDGHVIFENVTFNDKAAIVIKGNQTEVSNVECRQIEVKDGNGACVRLEGQHLILSHVYFHNSQQGLLTGSDPGLVSIQNSRFESLGFQGKAHGLYVGGGSLIISDSLFLAAKSQGHEIKSRALNTHIERSVIASLSSNDSRLIDISNGGTLFIKQSVLQQGPNSKNSEAIGFALEGQRYAVNDVTLISNLIILEKEGTNIFFRARGDVVPFSYRNVAISTSKVYELTDILENSFFPSREAAGIPPYPAIPTIELRR